MKIKERYIYKKYSLKAMMLLTTLVLAACSSENGESVVQQHDDAIVFETSQEGDSISSRSASLQTVTKRFRVWGQKNINSTTTNVFIGDYVNYVGTSGSIDESNGYGWSYLTGDNTTGQTLRYWDTEAASYNFMAGAPSAQVESGSMSSKTITLKGLKMSSFDAEGNESYSDAYFSQPKTMYYADFGKKVDLVFKHVLCQVRIAFCFADEQGSDQTLSGITLQPINSSDTYVTEGSTTVTYDFSKSTTSCSSSGTSSANPLSFEDITITKANSTSQTLATPSYMMIPQSHLSWQVSFTLEGKVKTAAIPEEYMQWKPGYQYTYVFKIGESSADVTLINVIQVAIKAWNPEPAIEHPVYNW